MQEKIKLGSRQPEQGAIITPDMIKDLAGITGPEGVQALAGFFEKTGPITAEIERLENE